jgi:hypothetical protein
MGQKSKKSGLVTIADGNSKLGVLPAISLIPGRDCGNCSHCILLTLHPILLCSQILASVSRNSGRMAT